MPNNIKERVARANERVAEARGECWHENVSRRGKKGDYFVDWHVCSNCGRYGQSKEKLQNDITNYASGPTEFLVLLWELEGKVKGSRNFLDIRMWEATVDISICDGYKKIHGIPPHRSVLSTAPTLALAVTEAWIELRDEGVV